MTAKVLIVTSDSGWILEKLAQAIKSSSVSHASDMDIKLDIGGNTVRHIAYGEYDLIYYMTYGSYTQRKSRIQVGYFTHVEDALGHEMTRQRFFDVARDMDYAILHGERYLKRLRSEVDIKCSCLSPGIDHASFTPILRIGVCGRTYNTGRKGEDIVRDLINLDFVKFYFTGDGWPGQATHLPTSMLPDFYRDMDYILVPSLYEAGPMCIPESLATGTSVICSDVGWANKFPVITFKNGDSQSLKNLLFRLHRKKLRLSKSTHDLTWERWGNEHLAIFSQLIKSDETLFGPSRKKSLSISLIRHGSENTDKGGPSVRVPRLATTLKMYGHEVKSIYWSHLLENANDDVVHVFNIWPPSSAIQCILEAKANGLPVVLSSIFLDLRYTMYAAGEFSKLLISEKDPDQITLEAAESYSTLRDQNLRDILAIDYREHVHSMLLMSDHVICLTEHERECLLSITSEDFRAKTSIIRNPLPLLCEINEPTHDRCSQPSFSEHFNIRTPFILCVGRIESRKNQLILARAIKEINHAGIIARVALVGSRGGPKGYCEAVFSNPQNVIEIGYLDNNSPLLRSAYQECACYVQLSFAEGISLATLEAYQYSARVLITLTAPNIECFGDDVDYLEPVDLSGLTDYIKRILNVGTSFLSDNPRRSHYAMSWSLHAKQTLKAYDMALANHEAGHASLWQLTQRLSRHRAISPSRGNLLVDLTTLCNNKGTPSGIARVEHIITTSLLGLTTSINLICWNGSNHAFQVVDRDDFAALNLSQYIKDLTGGQAVGQCCDAYVKSTIKHGSTYLVFGGAWIRNGRYVEHIVQLVSKYNLRLILMVHDIIQYVKHWWYGAESTEFIQNARRIIPFCSKIISISDQTTQDLLRFCTAEQCICPPIFRITQGADNLGRGALPPSNDASKQLLESFISAIGDGKFILCVNAIDIRKNHLMLLSCWEILFDELGSECPSLVMVGKRGWNSDYFVSQLLHHNLFNKKLFLLEGIYDNELQWLYSHASMCLNPSLYEGWGMPVAEAVLHAKLCLVSSASSLKEVAPYHSILLDPCNPREWAETISIYILNPDLLDAWENYVRSSYDPPKWTDAAQAIINCVDDARALVSFAPVIASSRKIRFNSSCQESRAYLFGFWELGRHSVCSKEQGAALCFYIPSTVSSISIDLDYRLPDKCFDLSWRVYVDGSVSLSRSVGSRIDVSFRPSVDAATLRHVFIEFSYKVVGAGLELRGERVVRLPGLELFAASIVMTLRSSADTPAIVEAHPLSLGELFHRRNKLSSHAFDAFVLHHASLIVDDFDRREFLRSADLIRLMSAKALG
ncbi:MULTISPECIES: glycosyltransferase [Aphanothece]|uniref:glycosyltransferase n=1 Tax=Aphanothece TaxID=1121 RepID=UPI003984F225